MKKGFIILLLILPIFIFISCKQSQEKKIAPIGFVSIKNKTFQLNGENFYPVVLNYKASLQMNNKEMWVSTYSLYEPNDKYQYTTKDSCLKQFRADMQVIKDLGFNAVRIVGVGEEGFRNNNPAISISIGNSRDTTLDLNDQNYSMYFSAMHELLNILDSVDLKAIILIRSIPSDAIAEKHAIRMLTEFSNRKALLAWDFFNEPLYFDAPERSKNEVYNIVNRWRSLMDQYAPNQLFTLGLTGPRETFEWDPNILNVDFISFHPYEFEPDQVANEIYWFGKNIYKPWIIGETALSANNDSVTYETQRAFAEMTLKRVLNCGGSGYSWWQYKDVDWFQYQSNFLGMLSKNGTTKTSKGEIVFGTPKPAAEEFKKFDPNMKKEDCKCLPTYYNYSDHKDYIFKGKLVDKDDKPIEGGVILAWNQWFGKSFHTFSKKDGSFELRGNFKFYHWIASATLMSSMRGDFDWNKSADSTSTNIPFYDAGKIQLNLLPFITLDDLKNKQNNQ